MKKIFQMIGLISLTCFSFFVTEKTSAVVNNLDDIMIQINQDKDNYKIDSIDAIIDSNTIIPGVRGRSVNVNKSYKNMKINGYYNDKLYVYDYINPKVTIKDNIDKYIIKGNPTKRMISLIFTVSLGDNIEDILKIINNYNIKATFFVSPSFFTENNDLVEILISDGHNVGIFLDDYTDYDFEWMDTVIKKINKQKVGFCYSISDNDSNIESCKLRNNYTIRPKVIESKTVLADIKKILEPGCMISLNANYEVKRELSTIIIYIKSKGYVLTNLEENILE